MAHSQEELRLQAAREMEALGNGRLAAFTSDGEKSRPADATPQIPQTLAGAAWRNAFDEGAFNDGGPELPIAANDGQSHRNGIRQAIAQRTQTRANSGNYTTVSSADRVVGPPSGFSRQPRPPPTYDPRNPSGRVQRQASRPLPSNYHQASLGGIVPPGAEVKRWNPRSQSQPSTIPGTLRTNHVTQQPARPSLTSPNQAPRGPQALRVSQAPQIPRVPQAPRASQASQALNAPQDAPGKPKLPLQPVSQNIPRSTLTNTTSAPGNTVGKTATDNTAARSNEIKVKKRLLPHEWTTQSNGQVQDTTPPSSDHVQDTASPNNVQFKRKTPPDSVRIIFRQQIGVGKEHEEVEAELSLYEELQDSTITWELSFASSEAVSGDIRECIKPSIYGSVVLLRRLGKDKTEVSSTRIQFPNIQSAKDFCKELGRCQTAKGNQPTTQVPTPTPQATQDINDGEQARHKPSNISQSVYDDLFGLEILPTSKPTRRPSEPSDQQMPSPVTAPEVETPTVVDEEVAVNQPESNPTSGSVSARVDAPNWDLDAIKAVSVGENLSQDSLCVISNLNYDESDQMMTVCSSFATSTEHAALQVALCQLVTKAPFQALGRVEQEEVVAVAYKNILHRGTQARVVRSAEQMSELRSSARSCTSEVSDVMKTIPRHSQSGQGLMALSISSARASRASTPAAGSQLARSIHNSEKHTEDPTPAEAEKPAKRTVSSEQDYVNLVDSWLNEPTSLEAPQEAPQESHQETHQETHQEMPATVDDSELVSDITKQFSQLNLVHPRRR